MHAIDQPLTFNNHPDAAEPVSDTEAFGLSIIGYGWSSQIPGLLVDFGEKTRVEIGEGRDDQK